MKKAVSLFLSILMVVSLLPLNVWAAEISEETAEEIVLDETEQEESAPSEELLEEELPKEEIIEEEISEEEPVLEEQEQGELVLEELPEEDAQNEHEVSDEGTNGAQGEYVESEFSEDATTLEASVVASGDCGGEGDGTNLKWSLDSNGVLTISGSGAMADYTVNYTGSGFVTTAPWRTYSGRFTSLVIEQGVETIGDYAFYEFSGFKGSLVIPKSVRTIGECAFIECKGFDSLTINSSYITIEDSAFMDCSGMRGRVAFYDSASLNEWSFYNCGIDDYYFGGRYPGVSAAYYDYPSFDEDDTLYYLADNSNWSSFAGGFKTIGIVDYGYCGGEEDGTNLVWTLDEYGVLTIFGTGAMADYSVNNNITTAPWAEYAEDLKSLVIEDGVTTVGKYAFHGCSRIMGKLVIPESITDIGESAFSSCSGFTGDIAIPNNVKKIGNGAFSGCSGFNGHLIVGEGVEWIDASAFVDCTGLNGRTIMPESLKKISGYAFYNCGVNEYYFRVNVPNVGNDVFDVNTDTIYYPAGNSTWEIVDGKWKGYNAKETIALGSCGTNLQWTLDSDGRLAVFGKGAMADYSSDSDITTAPWAEFIDYIKSLVIEEGITSIGSYAFYNCFNLTGNLVIPDSLTQINSYAFYETSISEITFGKSLKTIERYAFYNCTLNGNLVMPDSLIGIGAFAFAGCSQLSGDLIFFGNLKQIQGMAFNSCGINNYYFEGNAPSVNEASNSYPSFDALDDTIYYPANNTTWNAVDGRWKGYVVKTWNAPMGSGFCGGEGDGTNLEWVIDSEGTLTISGEGKMADYSYSEGAPWMSYMGSINSLVIGDGVETIGKYAFYNCDGITGNLTIGNSVYSIKDYAFYDCDGFNGNLIMGRNVSGIGYQAFYSCEGFTGNVVFSTSMSQLGHIDKEAFYNCGINNYYFKSSCPEMINPWDSNDTLYYVESQYHNGWSSVVDNYKKIKYAIAAGNCGENYRDLDWIIDLDGVLTISGSGKMANYSYENGGSGYYITTAPWGDYLDKFSSLVIENGVTNIGDYAFYSCSGLAGDLVIPDSVTDIGEYAFCDCTGFNGSLTIGNNVTTIEVRAFENCREFTGSLIIPDGVTTIMAEAFDGCSGFTGEFVIPDSVTEIDGAAFRGCSGLTGNLIIPNGITVIESWTFHGCSGFDGNLIVPDSVTTIGNYAFQNCSGFTGELIIPESVTAIRGCAFYNCGINKYYFEGNVPIIAGTSESSPSFDVDADTIYYPAGNSTWEIVDGKWNGYIAKEWDPNVIASGYCGGEGDGTNLEWVIGSDGVLTISGTGAMEDYGSSNGTTTAPWGQYADSLKTLVIEDGVTTVGDYAFYNALYLEGGITFPDSLVSIGRYAFQNVTSLDGEIVFGSGLKTIEDSALEGCINITGELILPEGLEAIGDEAFYACSKLTGDLEIPESVTSIGSGAFRGCSGFSGFLIVPEGVSSISSYAFYGCSGFDGELIIAGNVTEIGSYAFYGCSGLTGELVIPESVTSIGSYAFSGCSGFEGSVEIPEGVTTIGEKAFYGCGTNEYRFIGNAPAVTAASESAQSFDSDDVIYYPYNKSGWTVSEGKWNGYTAIKYNPEYPDAVAFGFCGASLEWMIDKNGVLTIFGTGAMYDYSRSHNGTEYVGNAPWMEYSDSITSLIIEEGATKIGDYAFYRCDFIGGSLVIPNSVTSIGNMAFYDCSGFTGNLTIGENVATIEEYAFSGCSGFTGKLVLPDNLGEIGEYAFKDCSGFTGDLVIPERVKRIEFCVFENCSGFNGKLVLPKTLTDIGSYSFKNCSGLKGKLLIPDSVTAIGNNAFAGCSGFTGDIVLPYGLEDVPNYIFEGCSGFDGTIVMPKSVTKIGEGAFMDCTGLSGEFTVPETVTTIEGNAFYNCGINDYYFGIKAPKVVAATAEKPSFDENDTIHYPGGSVKWYVENGKWNGYAAQKLEGILASGYCGGEGDGTNLQWSLDYDGTLTISGTGKMEDYNSEQRLVDTSSGYQTVEPKSTAPWYPYEDCIRNIVLEEGITEIGDYAFYSFSRVYSEIVIPEGVTNIGKYTFSITNFKGNLIIPESVKTIEYHAFYNSGFTGKLTLGSKITSIGEYAFYNCGFTGSLEIPENLTKIEKGVFCDCDKFTGELIIPKNVVSIGDSAFYKCSGFSGTVEISEKISSIGASAFKNCGADVYYFLGNAPSVTAASASNPSFDADSDKIVYQYENKTWMLESGKWNGYAVDIWSENYDDIGYCGAGNGENIVWIFDDGKLTLSGTGEMADYTEETVPWGDIKDEITELVLDDDITYIGDYAFYGCTNLTGSLTVSDKVTAIGGKAFYNCGIDEYQFYGDAPSVTAASASDPTFDSDDIIHYPSGNSTWVISNGKWNGYTAFAELCGYCGGEGDGKNLRWEIKDGVLTISGTGTMLSYERSGGITTAPWGAYGEELVSLVIESGVGSIGDNAFYGCEWFKNDLVIPYSIMSIGHSAFYNCNGFTGNLVIPNSVTTIGNSTFYDCSGLTGLVIGDYVEEIGNYAFYRCSGMTGHLEIPGTVSNIGNRAFYNCGINDYRFEGDAPTLKAASATGSFDEEADTIRYPEDNTTWEIVDGKWNGYNAVSHNAVIYGDISGDGKVDVQDAYLARLIAAKLQTPTAEQKELGDVDGDGKITAVDANYIRKFAVNIILEFPVNA